MINEQIRNNELSDKERGSAKLESVYKSANERTKRFYRPLIDIDRGAEKLRDLQKVVENFRLLLDIPSQLSKAVQQNDHERVVRLYYKALHTLTTDSALPPRQSLLVLKLRKQVEEIIVSFKNKLYLTLSSFDEPSDRQTAAIKFDPSHHITSHHITSHHISECESDLTNENG